MPGGLDAFIHSEKIQYQNTVWNDMIVESRLYVIDEETKV